MQEYDRLLGETLEGFVAVTRLEHLSLGLHPWAASHVAEFALRGIRRNAVGCLRTLQCYSHQPGLSKSRNDGNGDGAGGT